MYKSHVHQLQDIYLIYIYRNTARLFIAGGGEMQPIERTAQGDPLVTLWYYTGRCLHTPNV